MMKAVSAFFSTFLKLLIELWDFVFLFKLLNPFEWPKLLSLLIDIQHYVVRSLILNIKGERRSQVDKWLRKGDELCERRERPMSPELIANVIDIYNRCKSRKVFPPVLMALDTRLMDMAWGFLQCFSQLNTDPDDLSDIVLMDMLPQFYKHKERALDIAVGRHDVEVSRLLWKYFTEREKYLYPRKEALFSLLNDPIFNSSILAVLEDETGTDQSHNQQELGIYNRGKYRIVTPEFLDNLGNGLLGLNASKNTVLHLVCKIGNPASIEYLLKKDPSIIHCLNSDMETPAFVAAREGRVDILEYMIKLFKKEKLDIESVLTRNRDRQNALHIAIENDHLGVIVFLMKEIPELANRINESNESPLYLAAERGNIEVMERLFTYRLDGIAFEGPNGKTPLHGAAISNSAGCVEILLLKKRDLLNDKDVHGWTPLHHAVHQDSLLALKQLLSVDYSIGYHESFLKDGVNTSAIHIAASLGHCKTMEVLMDKCPGCTEFIDNKGRNILHVAIEHRKNNAINFIFGEASLSNLINQKDYDGNTPVHLLVASDFERMAMLMDSRVNLNALNNEKLTPFDKVSSNDQRNRLIKAKINKKTVVSPKVNMSALNKIEKPHINEGNTDKQFGIVNNLVVVVALTATASFTAALTVPDGFDSSDGSKQGIPFLLKKLAFQAFVVTNGLAFSLSCSVLLGHVALLFYRKRNVEASLSEQEYIEDKIDDMYYLTTWALLAMTIAFTAGAYVVLIPSLGLAIFICVMTLVVITFNTHKDRYLRSE